MSIDKLAQKRNWKDKVRETFDLGTKTLSLFDRQFADYMQKLRTADDFSRKEALKLTPILKESATLLAGSDYLGAAAKLVGFYEILESILSAFDVLTTHLKDERHQLLVDHLDDETKKNILRYYRRPKKTASEQERMTKGAGVLDWFAGKFNARRRALKSLEKRVPAVKQLRDQIKGELSNAQNLLALVLKYFEGLSKARSKGDINGYHNVINDMNRVITPAKAKFDKFYDVTVEPFIEYIESKITGNDPNRHGVKDLVEDRYKILPTEPELTNEAPAPDLKRPEMPKMPAEKLMQGPAAPGPAHPTTGNPVIQKMPPAVRPYMPYSAPNVPPAGSFVNPHAQTTTVTKPSAVPAPVPTGQSETVKVKKKEPSVSSIDGKPLPLKPPGRAGGQKADDSYVLDYSRASNHTQFITKLAEVDENDLQALAQEILAYSESLENSDPVASLKLLAIAEGLFDN